MLARISNGALSLLLLAVLASCGGGGGGSSGGSDGGNTSSLASGKYSISANLSSMSFKDYLSPDSNEYYPKNFTQKIVITFKGDGVIAGLAPGQPEGEVMRWLNILPSNQTATSVTFDISIFGGAVTPFKAYSTILRFVTGKADGTNPVYVDVPLSAMFGRYFYTDKTQIAMQRVIGSSKGTEETLHLTTVAESHWSIASKPDWVDVSTSSGQGATDILLSCNSKADNQPSSAGILSIMDATLNLSYPINVSCTTLKAEAIPSKYGVALTQLSNTSKLSDSIAVGFASGAAGNWQAASNQSWLKVTASGNEKTPLQITATSTNLGDKSMHYADITVNREGSTHTETIHVGLYKNTSVSLGASTLPSVNRPYDFVDPIRPYVYFHTFLDGVGEYDQLLAVNIYTNEIAQSYTLTGRCLLARDIAPDGSKIYFEEEQFCYGKQVYRQSTKIFKQDLFNASSDMQLLVDIPATEYSPDYEGFDLKAIVNNGVPAIILHPGVIYHGDTGAKLVDFKRFSTYYNGRVRTTPDGSRFFISGFIYTDIYSLFIPSDTASADVRQLFRTQADDIFVNSGTYNQNRFYIHPDGDLVIVPSTCIRFTNNTWQQNCTGHTGDEYTTTPDGSIISTYANISHSSNLGYYDKAFNFIAPVQYAGTRFLRQPLFSGDKLAILVYQWGENGASTETRILPYQR